MILRTEKNVFCVDFLNEVYRACDALNISVPDDVDTVETLEDMFCIANKIGCRLIPVLTSSLIEFYSREGEEEDYRQINNFFLELPSFRIKVIPDPAEQVFNYLFSFGECFFEALYFPDIEVCLIAKFSYRDMQMFKTIGDRDTDTRLAMGERARQCVDLLLG